MIINVEDSNDEELVHYGVRGMRWGVRRENRVNAIKRIGAGQGTLKDHLRTGVITKAGARHLSKRIEKFDSRFERVAGGNAKLRDRLIVWAQMTPEELTRGGGSIGASRIHVERQKAAQELLAKAGDQPVNKYLRSRQGRQDTKARLKELRINAHG